MSTRRARRPDLSTVAKDLILFGIGAGLIIRQGFLVPPQDFNLSILIFGGVVSGAQGMVHLWGLRPGTDGPSSPDQPEASPLPPSPSSSD